MIYKYMILLIFFISVSAPAADGLGRLFLTPDQRAQLDVARVKRDQRSPINSAAPPAAAVPQGPDIVTYNGVVRRSDGKSTVWINGRPVNERSRMRNDNDVNVLGMRRDGAVSVAIPQTDRTASLKVGQSLDVNSGRIEESYARRAPLPRDLENAATASPHPPAASTAAAPAVTARPTDSARPARPLRDSHFKESDPDSGAAPAERSLKK